MQSRIFRGASLIVLGAAFFVAAASCVVARRFIDNADQYWILIINVIIALFLFALIGVFAVWELAKFITKPLKEPAQGAAKYAELSPLLSHIKAQSSLIKEGESELLEKERGLNAIMENMTEGLVLLDSRGVVISINKSAKTLIGAPEGDWEGRHLFAVCREPELQATVHFAQAGQPSDEIINLKGSSLKVTASPVRVDGIVRAVVLFIFDVTASQAVEKMRREFSANVSHELKTPLTSITGFAEIIKDGIANPDDVPRFAENIYTESKRLLRLVEDILRLSKLDESQKVSEKVEISLLSVANQARESLADMANRYDVTVSVSGEDTKVEGDSLLLYEMIYNLCDNAIKYNKPGGAVDISIVKDKAAVILKVSDTGIGIPREHQDRVFERFYRVDKSHSKATGGTGLGLSIVKHGAKYHDATVELTSSPQTGTCVNLKFKALPDKK